MISAITLVESGVDLWMYQIIYDNKKYERTYVLPFEEMSFNERQTFINDMYMLAFKEELDVLTDQRASEKFEEVTGVNPEDLLSIDDEDDDEPEDVSPQHIVDILNDLSSRIEDIEIKLGNNEQPPTE